MAVDTAAKRYSALNTGNPWRGPSAIPSGTIGESARAAVVWLYSGLDYSADSGPSDYTGSRVRVFELPSVTGLVRWVDYIPVRVVTPGAGKTGTYDDSGCLAVVALASETGSIRWIDHLPVYSEGTDKWRYNDDGYIPIDTLTP